MNECKLPPEGWRCTREPGHEGPCAALSVVDVPGVGDDELPQSALTDAKLKFVLGGLLSPSQGFSKAMARRILNLEAGRAPDAPVPL